MDNVNLSPPINNQYYSKDPLANVTAPSGSVMLHNGASACYKSLHITPFPSRKKRKMSANVINCCASCVSPVVYPDLAYGLRSGAFPAILNLCIA